MLRLLPLIPLLIVLQRDLRAFSLLGPFESWMTPEVGFYRDPAYDVGGPRNLGDEFRWNLPVITYGFDDEFKRFFGEPGVAAIEDGVAFLNGLKPMEQIDLTTLPPDSLRFNENARAMGVYDLRSAALAQILEQLGLANSIRNSFLTTSVLAPLNADEENALAADFVIRRNFDPVNFEPSSFVNGYRVTYQIRTWASINFPMYPEGNRYAGIYSVSASPAPVAATPGINFAAGPSSSLRVGEYFTTLTRDDFGGLRYLYHSTNVNIEPTAAGVRAHGSSSQFVNVAARPGINNLSFLRFDPGSLPVTNIFTDTFVSNGVFHIQQLERVVSQPDILVTAAKHPGLVPALVRRSNPNFSHTNSAGAGIFQPGVVISFHKLADVYDDVYFYEPETGSVHEPVWGRFNNLSPVPQIFPSGPDYQGGRTLSMELSAEPDRQVIWKQRLIAGVSYAVETSMDLTAWTFFTNITGAPVHSFTNVLPNDAATFFMRTRREAGP